MKLKVWHAGKDSGEPPLGLFLADPSWRRARFWRFPRIVRRVIGWWLS